MAHAIADISEHISQAKLLSMWTSLGRKLHDRVLLSLENHSQGCSVASSTSSAVMMNCYLNNSETDDISLICFT